MKDVNVPVDGVAFAKDNTETNFAWALYAGLAYKVTPGLTIDLSYRYTDLGDAKSGIRTAYDLSGTAGGIEIEDITSHDLMFGVRLALGAQPAPMPVAFKAPQPSASRLTARLFDGRLFLCVGRRCKSPRT